MDARRDTLQLALTVAALTSVAAIPPIWPYGYYTLVRLVVFFACVYAMIVLRNTAPPHVVALAVIALLFNPFQRVGLPKGHWALIDLGVAFYLWRLAKSPLLAPSGKRSGAPEIELGDESGKRQGSDDPSIDRQRDQDTTNIPEWLSLGAQRVGGWLRTTLSPRAPFGSSEAAAREGGGVLAKAPGTLDKLDPQLQSAMADEIDRSVGRLSRIAQLLFFLALLAGFAAYYRQELRLVAESAVASIHPR